MTDAAIESEIQAKGLTAPRITPHDIESNILAQYAFTAYSALGEGVPRVDARQRAALIDHELTHLTVKTCEEEGAKDPVIVFDAVGRPKLSMRKHDHQFGWFDEVAQRHGEASPEVRQARVLMESSGQLYFDFEPRATVPPKGRKQPERVDLNG